MRMRLNTTRVLSAITVCPLLIAISCDQSSSDGGSGGEADSTAISFTPGFGSPELRVYEHTLEAFEQIQAPPGAPVTSQARVIRIFSMQPVSEEPEGGALIELQMQRVVLDIDSSVQGRIQIDTSDIAENEPDPRARALRNFASARLIMAMNADGTVAEVRGLDEAVRAAGVLPEGMSHFFSEAWFRAAAEGAWTATDGRTSVAVGEEWEDIQLASFNDAPDVSKTTFRKRLAAADDSIATVKGTAEMEIDFCRVELVGCDNGSVVDQMFEFEVRWDRALGCLLEQTTVQSAGVSFVYGSDGVSGLRVNRANSTASRLARLSPDGVASTLDVVEQRRQELETDVNPEASETEDPTPEQ